MDCSPPGSSVHGIPQARMLGVGCHFPLQQIFLPQGLTPCLLLGRWILYHRATREVYYTSIFKEKPLRGNGVYHSLLGKLTRMFHAFWIHRNGRDLKKQRQNHMPRGPSH